MAVQSYKDLIVWQKSVQLVTIVYKLTNQLPKSEMFGLTSQMRRCSISIPSNIAEGSRRGSRKDYRHFLLNSYGSGAELETQLEIAKQLPFGRNIDYYQADELLDEVMRMLNSMIKNLRP